METSQEKQIFDQFQRATKILVVLPASLNSDLVASGLALKLFLKKMQKEVEVVSSGPVLLEYGFLPEVKEVKSEIKNAKSLVVEVNTTEKKLEELSYQVLDNKLHIYLKSKNESFVPQDVTFLTDKFPVDLIVTLGCRSLENIGKVFLDNTELFYATPKINIDNKTGNEYFGAVNFVEISVSSLSELLVLLFEKYEQQLIDEDIATCLLTGIITKTNSFQHSHTTPQAFLKASQLVALGGRQQEIIKALYKTKPLGLLKLWGRALARLKVMESKKVAYSVLTPNDFEKTESTEELAPLALKELLQNVSGYEVLGLLTQAAVNGQVTAWFALHVEAQTEAFIKHLGEPVQILDMPAEPYKLYEFVLSNTTLTEAENKLLHSVLGL
jgi:nanoRNase/pAp phosphatase (c-di-AMP/oligoRNAs hydrolase)